MSQQQNNDMQQHFYRASAADFGKIPGGPIAYWLEKKSLSLFLEKGCLGERVESRCGMNTGDNDFFLRYWSEVSVSKIGRNIESVEEFLSSGFKYAPYNKGGAYRKWFGNVDYVIKFDAEHYAILANQGNHLPSRQFYFRENITWSDVTSVTSGVSFRYVPAGSVFDGAAAVAFPEKNETLELIGYLNNNFVGSVSVILNPTLHFKLNDFDKLPNAYLGLNGVGDISVKCVNIAMNDRCSYEFAIDYIGHLLVLPSCMGTKIITGYETVKQLWSKTTLEMKRLEQENNRLFIDAYGLQDELTPEVPLSEITLTCNPHYRYGGNLTDDEREARLQSDTICELISYAIGCMMGRYSLDREGLVYAHAGNEGFKALVDEGAYSTFTADDDGILPLTSENWFEDDVAARIEQFVASVWGNENLEENLNFIADSLCLYAIKPVKKGGETARETIRRYLSSQFYKDHLKTYKKRPIYWLFSSGKEKAFECLVYLHRYNESTLPRMRTEYVTPLLGQMASRIERKRMEQTEASTAEAKRIGKEIDSLNKQLTELRAFDDQLKHHADMRITLDLDDGVKVNYGKFGTLLSDVKAITGDKGE